MTDRFSTAELEQFEQKLQQYMEQAYGSLRNPSLEVQPVSLEQPIGRLSRMDALQRQQMAQAAKTRLEATIAQARSALARIRSGTFGDCLICGEEIDAERLRFSPAAPLCLSCQSQRER